MSGGAEWLSGLSRPEGQGDVPPTVSNLLLSTTIMVTPWPQASYLQKINGGGRGHVCLWRFGGLPSIELVAALLEDLRA